MKIIKNIAVKTNNKIFPKYPRTYSRLAAIAASPFLFSEIKTYFVNKNQMEKMIPGIAKKINPKIIIGSVIKVTQTYGKIKGLARRNISRNLNVSALSFKIIIIPACNHDDIIAIKIIATKENSPIVNQSISFDLKKLTNTAGAAIIAAMIPAEK